MKILRNISYYFSSYSPTISRKFVKRYVLGEQIFIAMKEKIFQLLASFSFC